MNLPKTLPPNPLAKLAVLSVMSMGAIGLYACIGELTDTVYFNNAEVDFGKPPPPMVVGFWGEYANRPVNHHRDANRDTDLYDDEYDTASADAVKMNETIARNLERPDSLAEAAKAWRQLARGKTSLAEAARDRAEVLEESQQAGFGAFVKRYLAARDLPPKAGEKEFAILAVTPEAGFIRPHALYAIASIRYDRGNLDAASGAYERAATFAKSSRREPSLIMAARSLLEVDSKQQTPKRITNARRLIGILLRERPQSRFRLNAEGWLARADYVSGDRLGALTKYYRALTNEKDPARHLSLLGSIRQVSKELSSAEATEMRTRLLKDPTLIEPYLNFRLYHTDPKASDLASLVSFARKAMAASGAKVSAGILARLSEIAYLQGNSALAMQLANQSLSNPAKVNSRADLATYVKAGVLKRKKDWVGVERVLVSYHEKFAQSYLDMSAQELLALAYEKQGDLGRAVDVFNRLGYALDVAYLVDVRMSIPELKSFTEARKATANGSLWRYSLGMRYMRAEQLNQAQEEFDKLAPDELAKFAMENSREFAWVDPESKSSPLDSLMDPLRTTKRLIEIRTAIDSARSPDSKATAMYELCSYYYEYRNLMFYNAPLWQGRRQALVSYPGLNDGVTDKGDRVSVQSHSYEHECLWKARKVGIALANAFPKAPEAGQALYRAACASRRLWSFNDWWRARNKTQDLSLDAANLMARLYKEHPTDPLAANAKKYEQVFRDEAKTEARLSLFTSTNANPVK